VNLHRRHLVDRVLSGLFISLFVQFALPETAVLAQGEDPTAGADYGKHLIVCAPAMTFRPPVAAAHLDDFIPPRPGADTLTGHGRNRGDTTSSVPGKWRMAQRLEPGPDPPTVLPSVAPPPTIISSTPRPAGTVSSLRSLARTNAFNYLRTRVL
jgi:hypothetical protein